MKKIRIVKTRENWFQCNIPMEYWTETIRTAIVRKCQEMGATGTMQLGSGYLKPGMKEIFYFI